MLERYEARAPFYQPTQLWIAAEVLKDPHAPGDVCTRVAGFNDFLASFTLPDCPDFDSWQFFQAERLRQQFAATLEKLVHLEQRQGDDERAIAHAQRWLALDPLNEPVHRALMTLYARTGQVAAALRQYQLCQQTLTDELGIAPAAETTALVERIRRGAWRQRDKETGRQGDRELFDRLRTKLRNWGRGENSRLTIWSMYRYPDKFFPPTRPRH
jgi:DNA-binding SARP family transcriptional activator